MTNLFTSKTNFTSGEIAHDLLGRVDLRAYENGAMALKNVFIEPTGGVYRRPGLKYICEVGEPARLIQFDLGYLESYLLILKDESMDVYLDGVLVQTLETPWTADQIFSVCWCQTSDTLFLVHPDVKPRLLKKSGDSFAFVPNLCSQRKTNVFYNRIINFAMITSPFLPRDWAGRFN